jgi:hypothetical protein
MQLRVSGKRLMLGTEVHKLNVRLVAPIAGSDTSEMRGSAMPIPACRALNYNDQSLR